MNHWMDRIQISKGGSMRMSDNLMKFWEEFIKKRLLTEDILKKWPPKNLVGAKSY